MKDYQGSVVFEGFSQGFSVFKLDVTKAFEFVRLSITHQSNVSNLRIEKTPKFKNIDMIIAILSTSLMIMEFLIFNVADKKYC